MAKRFFTSYTDGDIILIQDEEYHHLVNVMRAQIGEQITVCFNDGYDNLCEIISLGKNLATLKIMSRQKNNAEADIDVTLFQAVPKGDKLDLIVQKSTELGVKKIVPFLSKFTQTKAISVKSDRLKKVATEAAKQCGRAVVPEIEEVKTFSEVLKTLDEYDYILMPYELEKTREIKTALIKANKPTSIAIIIGSEGGFCIDEIEQAKQCGADIVSLGNRILRAETAAISVMSIVIYQFEQMKTGV